MRCLVIGYGYVGQALCPELLRQGHEVIACSRTKPASISLPFCQLDIAERSQFNQLPADIDAVFNLVSSSKGGLESYETVHGGGMDNLLEWAGAARIPRLIYSSSTSVYGQVNGELVDETSPAEPTTATSKVLLRAEAKLLARANAAFTPVVLRLGGIYGPERGFLLQQYLRGEASIIEEGDRYLNMVHRDDVVGALISSITAGSGIYNLVDNEPVQELEFFQWLSAQLKKPMPPTGAPVKDRKRAFTNKQVLNQKLRKELGYEFRYPTFREGYLSELKSLGLLP